MSDIQSKIPSILNSKSFVIKKADNPSVPGVDPKYNYNPVADYTPTPQQLKDQALQDLNKKVVGPKWTPPPGAFPPGFDHKSPEQKKIDFAARSNSPDNAKKWEDYSPKYNNTDESYIGPDGKRYIGRYNPYSGTQRPEVDKSTPQPETLPGWRGKLQERDIKEQDLVPGAKYKDPWDEFKNHSWFMREATKDRSWLPPDPLNSQAWTPGRGYNQFPQLMGGYGLLRKYDKDLEDATGTGFLPNWLSGNAKPEDKIPGMSLGEAALIAPWGKTVQGGKAVAQGTGKALSKVPSIFGRGAVTEGAATLPQVERLAPGVMKRDVPWRSQLGGDASRSEFKLPSRMNKADEGATTGSNTVEDVFDLQGQSVKNRKFTLPDEMVAPPKPVTEPVVPPQPKSESIPSFTPQPKSESIPSFTPQPKSESIPSSTPRPNSIPITEAPPLPKATPIPKVTTWSERHPYLRGIFDIADTLSGAPVIRRPITGLRHLFSHVNPETGKLVYGGINPGNYAKNMFLSWKTPLSGISLGLLPRMANVDPAEHEKGLTYGYNSALPILPGVRTLYQSAVDAYNYTTGNNWDPLNLNITKQDENDPTQLKSIKPPNVLDIAKMQIAAAKGIGEKIHPERFTYELPRMTARTLEGITRIPGQFLKLQDEGFATPEKTLIDTQKKYNTEFLRLIESNDPDEKKVIQDRLKRLQDEVRSIDTLSGPQGLTSARNHILYTQFKPRIMRVLETQNPGLSPAQLEDLFAKLNPEYMPDNTAFSRADIRKAGLPYNYIPDASNPSSPYGIVYRATQPATGFNLFGLGATNVGLNIPEQQATDNITKGISEFLSGKHYDTVLDQFNKNIQQSANVVDGTGVSALPMNIDVGQPPSTSTAPSAQGQPQGTPENYQVSADDKFQSDIKQTLANIRGEDGDAFLGLSRSNISDQFSRQLMDKGFAQFKDHLEQALLPGVGGVGALSSIITAVAKEPPPPNAPPEAKGYWDSLDPSSKTLIYLGLGLTAISFLKNMFGKDEKGEDEDDESFLMKVLPFLGIGAAAWGAGGGTLWGSKGVTLPQMDKYKALGEATMDLGSSIFGK